MNKLNKDVISRKQALAIAKNIKSMFNELKKMSIKILLDVVPDEEKNKVFVGIDQSKKDKMLVDIRIYNSLTKTIAIKSYTIIDLLRNCSDVSLVNMIVEKDMKDLYKKSKEHVYEKDTEVYLF